jgi:hypothetical protein
MQRPLESLTGHSFSGNEPALRAFNPWSIGAELLMSQVKLMSQDKLTNASSDERRLVLRMLCFWEEIATH